MSTTSAGPTLSAEPPTDAYGAPFWFTYANNTCLMVAASLLFRYADFVTLIGGTERDLGWIVGVGMVGSLLMRLAQGVGIDRYGPRRIWLWSVGLFTLSCALHPWVERPDGVFIYVLRILFATSIAGAFGSSITYIARRVSVPRMAEIVGTLGTSGFIGMVAGTYLGDLICGNGKGSPDRGQVNLLFIAATALGVLALIFGILATQGQVRPIRRRKPHVLWLVRRYQPGTVLLMGVAMGFGLGLPGIFLRPFTAALGFSSIAPFFLLYSTTAFITRLSIRRLPERIGIRPMIYWGMASLIGSMLAYLPVEHWWHLAPSAVLVGIAHATLFPAVVAGGSGAFPSRHRGIGTTLMLGTFDLGSLVGAPAIGNILHYAGRWGLRPYPTMFICVATMLTIATLVFAATRGTSKRGRDASIKIA